ncbi:hypothetical protein CEXT_656401 [Caerostris extrusa]|uniref:Uncharacterized protein n=1 Tax=Caerostris extrusa TaxID=172846 RepID=A0AAV4UGM2_CAEEX|nr:hypothetical protein CEXT_656401 [Caerostris extrusa]
MNSGRKKGEGFSLWALLSFPFYISSFYSYAPKDRRVDEINSSSLGGTPAVTSLPSHPPFKNSDDEKMAILEIFVG